MYLGLVAAHLIKGDKEEEEKEEKDLGESSPIVNAYFADFASKSHPHIIWKENYQSSYLDELICWEGRGDMMNKKLCQDCVAQGVQAPCAPVYRCLDCFLPNLTCQDCCIRQHWVQLLHIIKVCSSHKALAHFLTACFSNGMAPSLAKCCYNHLVYISSSAI